MRLPDPVFVTSIPRSGSSMIAGILSLCGIEQGQTINENKAYTVHLHENQRIRGLVSFAFKENLSDPQGQYPLPSRHFLLPYNFKKRCFATMLKEGVRSNWFYKDSRLPLIWEEINKEFPDAKWIIVCRDEKSILNSCRKTGFMKAFEKDGVLQQIGVDNVVQGWKWWLQQYQDRILEMQYALNVKFVYPEKMAFGDYKEMKEVVEWCGGKWKDKVVKEFIGPKLKGVV